MSSNVLNIVLNVLFNPDFFPCSSIGRVTSCNDEMRLTLQALEEADTVDDIEQAATNIQVKFSMSQSIQRYF